MPSAICFNLDKSKILLSRLDKSKLKAYVEDKINVAEILKVVSRKG